MNRLRLLVILGAAGFMLASAASQYCRASNASVRPGFPPQHAQLQQAAADFALHLTPSPASQAKFAARAERDFAELSFAWKLWGETAPVVLAVLGVAAISLILLTLMGLIVLARTNGMEGPRTNFQVPNNG